MRNLALALGKTIRELRQAKGVSQEAFAHEIGVHRTFVGIVERGETNVSLSNLVRIADGLGISPGDLLNRALPEPSARRARQ